MAVSVIALLGTLATFFVTPLNGNIRYEIGVKVSSTYSAAETFSHRPLAYRLLVDRVAHVADTLSFGLTSFELMVRVIGLAMAAGAGLLLWCGLRARNVDAAGLHAMVIVAAIVFFGAGSTAEADWMAVILATAATGVALLGYEPSTLAAGHCRGSTLRCGGGMKIVSLPTALIGLLVVGVLDRRQLVRTVAASTSLGPRMCSRRVIWVPWEIGWLIDIRAVQPEASGSFPAAATFFLESAARWPAVALLPAVLVLAGRNERLVLLAATLLAAAPIVGQGQYFTYHAVPLCVVVSVALFRTLRDRMSPTLVSGSWS